MYILVLNMGMKSIRSIIFDEYGDKISSSSITIETAVNDQRVEQNPDEWWDKGKIVIAESISKSGIDHIDYITVTTSASTLVCVDENGTPVYNAIMVSDKRSGGVETQQIKDAAGYQELWGKTGTEVSSSLLLPKILWIKNNRNDIYTKTYKFITSNDFLIYRLCGRFITDELNATKYFYEIDEGEYPKKLINELGIDIELLPGTAKTGTLVGTLLPDLVREWSLANEPKVVLSSYDAICSFIGSGVSEEGDSSDVSGTVTVFRTLTKKKNLRKNHKVYDIPFNQGDFRIVGGSNNMGGGLIEWVKQCYYLKEEYPYEVMEKEAGESETGANGLIFLPYLLGERAPIWNDNARGMFFGLERMHTRKDMTRAVFESAAFIDRTMIDAIEDTGIEVGRIKVSGGLSRVGRISQIKADVLGRDIEVLSEFETTSSGAAMIVLHAQESITLHELIDRFCKIRMVIRPDLKNKAVYDEVYELFKDVYETNKPLFDRRVKMLGRIQKSRKIQIENL